MNENNNEISPENSAQERAGEPKTDDTTQETQETKRDITQEIKNALEREDVRQLIYGNDEIVNEVIERYLRSLGGGVPVVRGLSALTPVRKPKTLSEAKAIVDGK